MKNRYRRTNEKKDNNSPSISFAEMLSGKTNKNLKKIEGKAKTLKKEASIKMLNPPTDDE